MPDHTMNDIIDAHVHVWQRPDATFPYDPHYNGPAADPGAFPPDELLSLAQPCGVKRIVLVQMSFYGTDNSFMLAMMKRYPSIFSGIAVVDHRSQNVEKELVRLHSLGVRGLRIQQQAEDNWLRTEEMRTLWRFATKSRLAVCCLANPKDLPEIGRMCEDFPDTTVVIDHMGRIGMDGSIHDENIQDLCRLAHWPRTNVKVSAFYALGKKKAPYNDLLPLVIALHGAYGARRLMWGSDSPFQIQPPYSYESSLNFVKHGMSFLSEDERSWLLRKTAEGIFF